MFFDRIDGERFFARLVALDLECPVCGRIHVIDTRTRNTKFRDRVPMFTCTNCNFQMLLGILGWRPNMGPTAVPPDTVPTPKQAWAIGELLAGHRLSHKTSYDNGHKRQVNVILRKNCTCQMVLIQGRWRVILSAACPVCTEEQVDPPQTSTPAKLMPVSEHFERAPRVPKILTSIDETATLDGDEEPD